jgi:hypothetical protein
MMSMKGRKRDGGSDCMAISHVDKQYFSELFVTNISLRNAQMLFVYMMYLLMFSGFNNLTNSSRRLGRGTKKAESMVVRGGAAGFVMIGERPH